MLYYIYAYAILVVLYFSPFCVPGTCPNRQIPGLPWVRHWRFNTRHDTFTTHTPDLNPRHVCPPCRSPAYRSIFSRSLPAHISHFSSCARPHIFSLFCYHPSHPCFLLHICAPLRRRYQCVSILPKGTPLFFFSDKTARARSQPTVPSLRRLQRSWRMRRKRRSRVNQSLSRTSRALVFGQYALPFFSR